MASVCDPEGFDNTSYGDPPTSDSIKEAIASFIQTGKAITNTPSVYASAILSIMQRDAISWDTAYSRFCVTQMEIERAEKQYGDASKTNTSNHC